MNIKALITTLAIVGSSSVAMARPATFTANASAEASWSWGSTGTVRDHRYYQPVQQPAPVRDHRYHQPVQQPAPVIVRAPIRQTYNRNQLRWANYSSDDIGYYQPRAQLLSDSLNFGDTEYRKDIVIGAGSRQFSALRLDANGGNTFLMKVVIEFADGGAVQQIDLNRTLRGNQSMTLDLSGNVRTLHRILVYRSDGGPAMNLNQPHYGAFTVSAL